MTRGDKKVLVAAMFSVPAGGKCGSAKEALEKAEAFLSVCDREGKGDAGVLTEGPKKERLTEGRK